MNISARLLFFLPLLLLAACARPDAGRLGTAAADCPPSASHVLGERAMLRYSRCLSTLPPAKLATEYDRVNGHFQHTGNDADRVKLALLLAVPDTSFHNPATALRLLAPSPERSGVPTDLRDLADMLLTTLQRQQAAEQKVRSLEKELAAEKQHAGALQVKIDSVKNLERTMTRRAEP